MRILVKGPNGQTAPLDAEQLKIANPTLTDMMNGKISVKLANDVILQKLEDAGRPINFGDVS